MKFLVRTFISWLPLAVAISGMCLLVYATVQQNYRQSLNDPQIQMAEDAAQAILNGEVPAGVVPRRQPLDIAESLLPWIAVYDANGIPLESSGVLDNAPPKPPLSVLEAAQAGRGKDVPTLHAKENRVSWQPKSDVRQAIVVEAVPGIDSYVYVVAGRNMREVENREQQLSFFVLLAWITLLAATYVAGAVARYLS